MNPDALASILVEIAAAMRPKRFEGQWIKAAENKAAGRIEHLTTRVMVELAQRVNPNILAETLAGIAVAEGAYTDVTLARADYRDRLKTA